MFPIVFDVTVKSANEMIIAPKLPQARGLLNLSDILIDNEDENFLITLTTEASDSPSCIPAILTNLSQKKDEYKGIFDTSSSGDAVFYSIIFEMTKSDKDQLVTDFLESFYHVVNVTLASKQSISKALGELSIASPLAAPTEKEVAAVAGLARLFQQSKKAVEQKPADEEKLVDEHPAKRRRPAKKGW